MNLLDRLCIAILAVALPLPFVVGGVLLHQLLGGWGVSLREFTCQGCGTTGMQTAQAPRRKWCSDRCRKQTLYAGTCIDCGAPTNGSDGRGPNAAKRCIPCRLRWQHENARWTKEAIVAAMRSWAVEHGSPPDADDWRVQGGRPVPSLTTVQYVFGTWSDGLEAAGFPRTPQRYPGDDPAVVAETIRLYRDEGLSLSAVAKRMDITPMGVWWRLERNGIPRRPQGRQQVVA